MQWSGVEWSGVDWSGVVNRRLTGVTVLLVVTVGKDGLQTFCGQNIPSGERVIACSVVSVVSLRYCCVAAAMYPAVSF